ncbi:Replication-associated protein [Dirofilaria immitis]
MELLAKKHALQQEENITNATSIQFPSTIFNSNGKTTKRNAHRKSESLADSKPHCVQIKGGFVKFNSKAIVITSNKIPEHWWKRSTVFKYDMRAFDRRATYTWRRTDTIDEAYFGHKFDFQLTSD